MLTYEDCVGLCALTEEEIAAIAEHEHIPEIIAMELGNYLVNSPEGVPMIRRMILDDIEVARQKYQIKRMAELKLVLQHFVKSHAASRTTTRAAD